jgi:hypothetical protein
MKNIITFTLLILNSYLAISQTLEQQLFDLEGVQFSKIETPDGYDSAYELRIKQPIDHNDPTKGYFYQKVFLSHRNQAAPMVQITEGYNRARNRMYELTDLISGNQLDIEHRFYGASLPDSMDYEYLNLEQSTADHHRINLLFKQIYKGKWISTGISKGGQTSIYYRYFYPDDVDVSVAYVAPLNLEREEKRIYDFLDNKGSEKCRKDIYNVQLKLLNNREEVLNNLKWYSKGADITFTYLTPEEAFEYAVLEYPFSFWQWGGVCDAIPSEDQSVAVHLEHFLDVSGISFFSDRDMNAYASHYYQAADEMGYYGYNTRDFKGLLKALGTDANPSAIFTPEKKDIPFDNTLAHKTFDWIQDHGDQFIYINGADDTWSATAIPENKKRDALWFFLEGADHGEARIKYMNDAQKARLTEKLEEWLEMDIK